MTLDVSKRKNRMRVGMYRVIADGVDISKHTFYADGRRKVARVYLHIVGTGRVGVHLSPSTSYDIPVSGLVRRIALRPNEIAWAEVKFKSLRFKRK